ncbi:aminotransferase class V-fold PLP-dependent enzyme [Clostridium tertium]|uniref:aminotransferase class V-fold PLP-dependent enzyme n=1 Tax=Clostridium TaxID=1485 RepID=UPI00232CED9B|nr:MULTISPECIES: aminotransferase class V-fold PLP-dependent enzyme [Clostridium]MDB1923904.1 aminotransferase class V-fold PLP-dependent enzyme [Clostridium tertium]MDB1926979.1 aminotransferase class V-fold PLP-dependent enzyme [Clostridium tertium]MDB1930695.1 aminotransferase class V-fold PLP-dependent enzyme [Clostridium tertium]MDU2158153.1 aminotransferase class V-fold PLP-dependent enzyme [Clostridium sp.]MDU7148225.1 aminotransferase class V-fold PLP-dependent enzyme [Clostridium sp.]
MIYLDNAATSFPKPSKVYEEVLNCMKNYCANPGRGSHDMAIISAMKVMETRNLICELFNIKDPFNLIFTSNATEALNIAIKGVLKNGDHVISTVIEHNSVLRPLNSMEKQGVEITLVGVDKAGYVNPLDIKNEIKKNTKIIIINHISNVLGSIQDITSIGKIAREKEIIFMVDASQSAGVISIDVESSYIDLLAFPGHKGLLGPQGTGGLFIREGINLSNFNEGGTGSNSHFMIQPDFMPDKFESGTLNTPGIAGLCEGLKFIKRVGIDSIKKVEDELMKYFIDEIRKLSYIKIYGNNSLNERSAVVSFNIDGVDASIVGEELNEYGIAVRTGYHCTPLIHDIIGTEYAGTVRVSLGCFNVLQDIDELLESIRKIYNSQ